MFSKISIFSLIILLGACSNDSPIKEKIKEPTENPDPDVKPDPDPNPKITIDLSKWTLTWNDEFDYDNSKLEEKWISQNSKSGGFVLSSRWRENAVVKNGILELLAKKETKGGQEWTTGNIWTKETFNYGYYECRYKYAGATGTNNSFWLWPMKGVKSGEKAIELDINEGHFPNEINTNIHNWTDKWIEDGLEKHSVNPMPFAIGGSQKKPDYSTILDNSITAKKLRFSSNNGSHFHMREFKIYAPNSLGYPTNILAESTDNTITGLTNHAKSNDVSITVSGNYNATTNSRNIADNKTSTSWISQIDGEKWIEFNWTDSKKIGAIQFVNGWKNGSQWNGMIDGYTIQYHNGTEWIDLINYSIYGDEDFSKDYHTYGVMWNKDVHEFYYDGELIRSIPNENNHANTNILLSLAVLKGGIAGPVTDVIDGTSMKVDYVRYYTPIE
ncbi:family 16 glycosylhydrolase [Wenyingzhuangia aestuarii]|uniref:family 16 glycosylhydrolase n=1 Tax=Wenyingzhuangia aestuarii TaxID=1647582 RepID=UPI00143ADC1B|nr:family 16 glycosylhydrolase [Wenyingzhuangia aestuarii]NJB82543.1 beta-glucanase (GH16 family) [Wenyingzhuangia aestuarii]